MMKDSSQVYNDMFAEGLIWPNNMINIDAVYYFCL